MNKYKSLLVAILLLFVQGLEAQSVHQENDPQIIPFELTDHNNIAIKAVLNDADTIRLMFHTATGSMTLTQKASENLSSINWQSETDVNTWGGSAEARYSESNSLAISGLKWDSLAIWETQHSGPETDGKFGPNLFEGSVLEIDFDKSVLKIHNTLPRKAKDFTKMNLFYVNGFMFIQGASTIDGVDYINRFLIHSGYGGSVLYDDKFVAESKIGDLIEIIAEKELKDSYGNTLKTKKGIVPLFTIGEEEFADMPVGFFEGAIGRQQMSVVGGDLLKRFNLIIDAEREYIYMKPNQLYDSAYGQI